MPLLLALTVLSLGVAAGLGAQPKSAGEMVIAWHVTIAPAWFDPSTAPPQVTPFGLLYALHDALVRPLPGKKMGNSLAESWTESPDGLVYEFRLRQGLKFHNDDPVTAEDMKFSFERYKGTMASQIRSRVKAVNVVDPLTVRFELHEPWPDFMLLYGTTASAVGLVVPKRYIERVGEDGFRQHPIGAGPYRFVSHVPGVEVVLEAYEGYWRKVPDVKRLTMKGIPEGTTRLAMLKNGEADIAFAMDGPEAEEVKRDSRLTLVDTRHASIFWLEFADQWDPKSVWADQRVRLAANYALDRKVISEVACLGYCPPAGVIVPRVMDYALQVEAPPYDPDKAKALLKEAGHDENNPVEFELILNNDAPFFADAATLMKSQMEKIGVKMKLTMMDKPAWLDRFLNKYEYQMAMEDFGALVDINQRSVSFFKGVRSNYGGMDSPEIEELTMKWRRTVDESKRQEITHDIQRAFAKDMLWCNITGSPYFQAYRDHVKGYHFMNQLYVHWETTWMDKA
jgi:peptide/nickel transport system substrate-binding protein